MRNTNSEEMKEINGRDDDNNSYEGRRNDGVLPPDEIENDDVDSYYESSAEDLKRSPPWTKHLTVRGLFASVAIGIMYSVIVMKLSLTTGLVPTLNVSTALVAFVLVKTWTKLLEKIGINSTPFTKQENNVIQTCAVACYSIAFGGGFGSYLLGLNRKTYEQAGPDTGANNPTSIKEPGIGWMTGFTFVSCFVGILALVPLRKIMILDYKLTYPSGTATAVLINGFHTSKGDKTGKQQVRGFLKVFSFSFLWACFQWFFSGHGDCGFAQFPTFGLKAYQNSFFFDFSPTYVGAGMICTHLVNLSLLLGAVVSYGIMWPLIGSSDWYSSAIPKSSMKSLNGYKVFVSIALILGDGLYNFSKITYFTGRNIHLKMKNKNLKTFPENDDGNSDNKDKRSLLERRQDEIFIRESIPTWISIVGYIILSIVSIIVIPIMFHEVKWYYVLVAYIIAPPLSFCNAYGAGLTDMNMAYNYGKVALFILAAIGGRQEGVVAGLVGCGLIKSIVVVSADLMHDFKTGHLAFTSPRSMFLGQVIGTALGCVIGPVTFFLFYKAFDIGNPDGEFKAPYALVYRNMAIVGVEGFSALPQHCLQLCYGFFAFAVLANLVRDFGPKKIGRLMPVPMAMAVPFLVGGYFAIDMCVGSLIVYVWNKIDTNKAKVMVPAVSSGLICGDGLWLLPSSVLALFKVSPPICMRFLKNI